MGEGSKDLFWQRGYFVQKYYVYVSQESPPPSLPLNFQPSEGMRSQKLFTAEEEVDDDDKKLPRCMYIFYKYS